MRLRICLIMALFFAPSLCYGYTASSYEDAVTYAKENKVNIVITFTATWCGPCKQFKKHTLSNGAVKTELDKFAYYNCDTDKDSSTAKKFKVGSIPNTKMIYTNGHVLQSTGMLSPVKFINWLRRL